MEQKAVIQSTIGLNVRLNFTFLLENGFDFADKMFCLFEYSTIQSSSQLFQLKFCQNSYHSCLTSFFCPDLSKILLAIYYNLFSPLFLLFSRLKWRTQCPVNWRLIEYRNFPSFCFLLYSACILDVFHPSTPPCSVNVPYVPGIRDLWWKVFYQTPRANWVIRLSSSCLGLPHLSTAQRGN